MVLYKSIKIKGLLLIQIAAITTISFGQTATDDFTKFASRQDSLMMASYEKKDAEAYEETLKEFLTRYDKLSESDRKIFLRHLIGAYYNFSCVNSLLNNKPMAMTYLKKAIEAGFTDYQHIIDDRDLDNIRNEKQFKYLLEKLRGVWDYSYILKKGEQYNYSDNRLIAKFTYQSCDNPNLRVLRKVFNLDSIAGQGNSESRIINVLHWVHYLIPQQDESENPVVRNVMRMIAWCNADKRGLNCRGLCVVLNECYLALGFKSRIVNCLPKDSLKIDTDCHLINAVYSDTYNKWLWIDPTNYVYLMNEKGELLSVEEVRSRIIRNEPLILNPDANWNRQISVTKKYYMDYYMTKNLYSLESAINSAYSSDASESCQSFTFDKIRLLPLDYYKQAPDKTQVRCFWTNNPKLFWQAP
jgi:hypothetical protein